MKKFKKIVYPILAVCGLAVIFVSIFLTANYSGVVLFSISSCSKNNKEKTTAPDGELFNQAVLNFYELSWLEKPQNAIDYQSYRYESWHYMDCLLSDIDYCSAYVKEVFDSLTDKGYITAYRKEYVDNGIWNYSYSKMTASSEISDFYSVINDATGYYRFYYSNSEPEKYSENYGGKKLNDLFVLDFRFSLAPDSDGLHTFSIGLCTASGNNNYLCE